MDNLPELRDIHLPSDSISIFPLAYGWWMVLLLAISTFVFVKLLLWLKRNSAKLYARKLLLPLKEQKNLASVVKMSEILRRVCVRKYPQAVAMFGNEWIEFLNIHSREPLNENTAELLKNAPFMNQNLPLPDNMEIDSLWKFCYEWIGDNL